MFNYKQTPASIMMMRPAAFGFNPETADSNLFQSLDDSDPREISRNCLLEFDKMVDVLTSHGISVHVFDDTPRPLKPDAIFTNNWVSFHENGQVVLYPMMAENRRAERRPDIISFLGKNYQIQEIIDLSDREIQGRYLEGTGSIVFDHVNRLAYACRSVRTDESVLQWLCDRIGYTPVIFDAVDEKNKPVYHTNVVMSIGSMFVVLCLDAIHSDRDQEVLLEKFSATQHKVIAISYDQMRAFAGNMLEVRMRYGDSAVLISEHAFNSLLPGQVDAISRFGELIPLSVSNVEKYGGGSVRCMVAGIHLQEKAS